MLKKTVLDFFPNQMAISEKLEISPAAVSKWPEIIPEKQALKLHRLTRGKLKYDPDLYELAN